MADRAKVIDGLKHCAVKQDCGGCPYKEACWSTPDGLGSMFIPVMRDALELLEGGVE